MGVIKKPPVKKAARKGRKETDVTEEFLALKAEELQIRELKWTRKQTDLVNLILGSVATKVIAGCTVPVLLVR